MNDEAFLHNKTKSEYLNAPCLIVVKDGNIYAYDDETSEVLGNETPKSYWTDEKMNQKLEEQEERIMQKMNQNFEEQEKRISENIFGKLMKEVHQMLLDQMFAFEEQYGRALTLAVEELKYRNSIERAQDQRIESLEERYQTNSAFIYSHEKRISNLENNSKKII